jgi:alanine-glyoxylate transaminase/serine-glyoxylate transaminase/serine-pyruvate transaminase
MSYQNPVFIPGPTNMPEVIRKACDMPTLDHRSSLFAEILHPALNGVRKVLKSQDAEVFVFPSTGTGGWEAALTNTLSAGDTVLAARNGMFSHRWIDMCQRHGLIVDVLETPWGEGLPADRYEEALKADISHKIKAVLATHNETATGVVSDIAAVRKAIDAAGHPALLGGRYCRRRFAKRLYDASGSGHHRCQCQSDVAYRNSQPATHIL